MIPPRVQITSRGGAHATEGDPTDHLTIRLMRYNKIFEVLKTGKLDKRFMKLGPALHVPFSE